MTKENAKQFLPIIKAWSEGKTIQTSNDDGEWSDVEGGMVFNMHPSRYRIKPEPKLRSWTYLEFPVGCWLKSKCQPEFLHFVVFIWENGVRICDSLDRGITLNFEQLLRDYKHSTDAGKTWLTCGVEESQ